MGNHSFHPVIPFNITLCPQNIRAIGSYDFELVRKINVKLGTLHVDGAPGGSVLRGLEVRKLPALQGEIPCLEVGVDCTSLHEETVLIDWDGRIEWIRRRCFSRGISWW